MNPHIPQLYSLIKLLSNCKFSPEYCIKNSLELTTKIKEIHLPINAKLISFDVCNLFPSISASEAINLVLDLLDKNSINPVIKSEIIWALQICLGQNYFQFNNINYRSKEGLIMGNLLSPLMAEFFMDNIERIIHQHPLSNKFLYWFRYVDDICLFYWY